MGHYYITGTQHEAPRLAPPHPLMRLPPHQRPANCGLGSEAGALAKASLPEAFRGRQSVNSPEGRVWIRSSPCDRALGGLSFQAMATIEAQFCNNMTSIVSCGCKLDA